MLNRTHRLALFMEGALGEDFGKMGHGVLRYSPNEIVCAIDSRFAGRDAQEVTGIPRSCPVVATVDEAAALGANVFLLGIAPSGGLIPDDWIPSIDRAVELGMSLVNGLHDLLAARYPNLPAGQWVWDLRVEPTGIGVATGAAAALNNVRVLLIGSDMAVGKMTAGLELLREAERREVKAGFVATGQIGIAIVGGGVPLDAVRVDFASGAIEREVLRLSDAKLVIVEGQGALIHPGSSANLPLLRGSCPTHLVLCHRAGQTHLSKVPNVAIPPLREYWGLYEDLAEACGTFVRPRTVGIALNTFHLGDADAVEAAAAIEREYGLPCVDPVRHGVGRLLDALPL